MAVPRSHTSQEQTQIYAALERDVKPAGSCVARRNMYQFRPKVEASTVGASTLRIFRTESGRFKGSLRRPSVVFMPTLKPWREMVRGGSGAEMRSYQSLQHSSGGEAE
ncbi:hypothetical protein E5D57_001940 [Metarhizium anisopliae]|nr:hypothetical protein E5D57_001940 [Metarhizium anisopliae]